MIDPIADTIIRIKNGYLARRKNVAIPYSKMNKAISDILLTEKYIEKVEIEGSDPHKTLVVELRYVGKIPAITDVKRESKPGRRVYSSVSTLPKALGGYGIVIMSTNKGVMTEKEARKQGVGGEVLCSIW